MAASGPFTSWGRVVRCPHDIEIPTFRDELPAMVRQPSPRGTLAVGLGRSYGDSGLNPDGRLIKMTALDRMIAFDPVSGRVRAEAGLSLSALLQHIVPRGWFTTTTPGTRFVTLGGAVANDVHGKNHHVAGSFGSAVQGIELIRSDRGRMDIAPGDADGLFEATIGGLGLTGVMASVDLKLTPIGSAFVEVERIAFDNVGAYFALSAASAATHEHTVAWIDCASGGDKLGRGIFQRANWCDDGELVPHADTGGRSVPVDLPASVLTPATVRLFNAVYYRAQKRGSARQKVHYAPFFYPLDGLRQWNRIYGHRGLYQYQCAVPLSAAPDAIPELLAIISKTGAGSFLAVLKTLGSKRSPGLLSFARQGVTLALDFPNRGQPTLDCLAKLDRVVMEADGWHYPAKDGRMPAAVFQQGYPEWTQFARHVDPVLTSAFWQRVSVSKPR